MRQLKSAKSCSTRAASSRPNTRLWSPKGERRMSAANPHANGGILMRDLRMPDFCDYAVAVPSSRCGRC